MTEEQDLKNEKTSLDEKSQYLFNLALTGGMGKLPDLDLSMAEVRYHTKKLIVFEGINACGKTTQINRLKESNDRLFFTPKYTGILPEKIVFSNLEGYFNSKLCAVKESLLFMAIETYREYICASEEQEFVVLDRYTPTIENFQVLRLVEEGHNLSDSINWLKRLSSFVPESQLILYLDIDVNTSISRLTNRGKDNKLRKEFTERDMDKANLIHSLYKKMVERMPAMVSIDGKREIDSVFSDVHSVLSYYMNRL